MTSYPSTPRPSRPNPTPTQWDSSPSGQPTNHVARNDVPSSPRADRQQPIMIQNFELLKPNQLQFKRKSLSTANLFLSQASLQRKGSPAVHNNNNNYNYNNKNVHKQSPAPATANSRQSQQINPPSKASDNNNTHAQSDYVTKNQPIKSSHIYSSRNNHHSAAKTLTSSPSKPKRVTFSAKNTFHRYEPKPEEHFQWANYTRDLDPDGQVWYRQKSFIYPADDDQYVNGCVASLHNKHAYSISSNVEDRRPHSDGSVDIPIGLLLEKFSFDKDRNDSKKMKDQNNNSHSFGNLHHQIMSNADSPDDLKHHNGNADVDDKMLQNVTTESLASGNKPRPHTVPSSKVYNPLTPSPCPDLDSQTYWSSGQSGSGDHGSPVTSSPTPGHSSGNLTQSRVISPDHNPDSSEPDEEREVADSGTTGNGIVTNQHMGYFGTAGIHETGPPGSWIQSSDESTQCTSSASLERRNPGQSRSASTSTNVAWSAAADDKGLVSLSSRGDDDEDASSIIANPDDGDDDGDDNNDSDVTAHKRERHPDIPPIHSDNRHMMSEETKGSSVNPNDIKCINADDVTKRVPCPVSVSSFYDAFQEYAHIENSGPARQPERSAHSHSHPKNYQSPNQFMNSSPAWETLRALKCQTHAIGNSHRHTTSSQDHDKNSNGNIVVSQKIIRLNFLKDADPRLKPVKHKHDVLNSNLLQQEYYYYEGSCPSLEPGASNIAVTGVPLRVDGTHGVHSNPSGCVRPETQPLPLRPSINLTNHVRPLSRGDINAQFLMSFYSSSGDKKTPCNVTNLDLNNSTSSNNQNNSSRDNNIKGKRVTFDRDVTDCGIEGESDPVIRSSRGREIERKMISSASSARLNGRGQRTGSRSHSASSSRIFANGNSLQVRGGGVSSSEAESIVGKEGSRLKMAERFLVRNSSRTAMNRRLEELVRSRSLSSRMRHTMERAKTDLT